MENITHLWKAIDHFLATPPYHPCLLLIHPEIPRLRATAAAIVKRYAWPTLSVGPTLSQALLTVAPDHRPRRAQSAFLETIQASAHAPLLCTDIDLLFEPALKLDPLRLLLDASRQTLLVVCWPGSLTGTSLAYAAAGHAHYRAWPRSELCDYCAVML